MKENIELGIKGHVKITLNGKIVFDDHNTITGNAFEILLRGLANLPNSYNLDQIRMIGDFGMVDKLITNTIINPGESTIIFIAEAEDIDFSGTLTGLKLRMSSVDLTFAELEDLAIEKDGNFTLEVQWEIQLNDCA